MHLTFMQQGPGTYFRHVTSWLVKQMLVDFAKLQQNLTTSLEYEITLYLSE